MHDNSSAQASNEEVVSVENELSCRKCDNTLRVYESYASSSSSSDASSMSRRRLAANRPTLDRILPLPPAQVFDKFSIGHQSLSCDTNLSSPPCVTPSATGPSTSYSPDVPTTANDEDPVTPVDQVLHERSTPPDAPLPKTRKAKRPSLLTSLLSMSLSNINDAMTSPYPFTPMEYQPSSPVLTLGPSDATPSQRDIIRDEDPDQYETPPAQGSSLTLLEPHRPSALSDYHKSQSHIPRRLSYSRPLPSTPSPLDLDNHVPPQSLASPLLLQAPRFTVLSRSAQAIPSPGLRIDSPNYFDI